MNIVFVASSNYAVFTAVTLQSLFLHNYGKVKNVFLISTNFALEDQQKFEHICEVGGGNFYTIIVEEKELEDFENLGDWPKYTFLKLFIPRLLPSNIDRVLYLDGDMLITDGLSEIYELDMRDNALAAVGDYPVIESCNRRCSLPKENYYVNSGFMLIDMKKWREAVNVNAFERQINRLKSIASRINDQDVINSTFAGRIARISCRYNVTIVFFGITSPLLPGMKEVWLEGRRNPAVIHFTNSRKPWNPIVCHPYKKDWFDVLGQTPYRNTLKKWKIGWPLLMNWAKYLIGEIMDRIRQSNV